MDAKEEVRQVVANYEAEIKAANRKRAVAIAAFADRISQKDIIEGSGYSRETVRRLTAEGRAPAAQPTTEES